MRRLLGTLLLLLQFGPLAGAGLCIHAAARPRAECAMPMQGMSHEGDRQPSSPAQDCGHVFVCAPPAPMVPAMVERLGAVRPALPQFATPASLLTGEPITPPQPPPIV